MTFKTGALVVFGYVLAAIGAGHALADVTDVDYNWLYLMCSAALGLGGGLQATIDQEWVD